MKILKQLNQLSRSFAKPRFILNNEEGLKIDFFKMDRKIVLETNEKAREEAWSKYMEQLNSLDHFLQSNITLNSTTKVYYQIDGLYSPSDWLVFVLR